MVAQVDSRLFFPQDDQPGQERAWQEGQPWLDRRPGGHPRLLDQRGVRRWRQRTHHWRWTGDFFHLLPKRGTNFYVCLIEGAARVFPTSYAPTGNWTHISSVAPLLRDLKPGHFSDWATVVAASEQVTGFICLTFCLVPLSKTGHTNFEVTLQDWRDVITYPFI